MRHVTVRLASGSDLTFPEDAVVGDLETQLQTAGAVLEVRAPDGSVAFVRVAAIEYVRIVEGGG